MADRPEYIAEQTVRHGWQGRVAVGHLTELASQTPAELDAARISSYGTPTAPRT